jgi:hypothetical protein
MIERIPLTGRVRGGASLEFLTVDVPIELDRYIPFALVRYAIDGCEQAQGIRLDLDKGTFADHFQNPEQDAILKGASGLIISIVADRLRRVTYDRLRKEFD